jgi:hypothetical protein
MTPIGNSADDGAAGFWSRSRPGPKKSRQLRPSRGLPGDGALNHWRLIPGKEKGGRSRPKVYG